MLSSDLKDSWSSRVRHGYDPPKLRSMLGRKYVKLYLQYQDTILTIAARGGEGST